MAVAPIIDGKVDYNSVTVIAAGTDPNNKTDNPVNNPITGNPAASILSIPQQSDAFWLFLYSL